MSYWPDSEGVALIAAVLVSKSVFDCDVGGRKGVRGAPRMERTVGSWKKASSVGEEVTESRAMTAL